ncbi:InlB B-repeat-containing protein [Saccharibacillus sp. CPCC 101409]|uniref:InlB B-repeat-containing protein n=1 Tax=Saccharibacillus sp. CPCC 101409 TaxID=3058041 RepID=UPI0026739520|nr:InlB B-repeat-containing protein [Saccharibacillus sp. CPCC 101409]MDO3411533.1 InlB B-repeat-containing protein [Saccharibacillus sp. CPCC 101409]
METRKIHTRAAKAGLAFLLVLVLVLGNLAAPGRANASSIDPYVGEIRMFTGTYAPYGWAYSDGQLLDTQQYPELYQLIGSRYGGDGIRTFALPDLRGEAPTGGIGYYISLTGRYPSSQDGSDPSQADAASATGELRLFPYTTADLLPPGWQPADGRMLPVADYPNLYDQIGNAYGGDTVQFALPKLEAPLAADGSMYAIAVNGVSEPKEPQIGDVVLIAGSQRSMSLLRPANGALLPVNQYPALFAVIGTRFGGDGYNTFALPAQTSTNGIYSYIAVKGQYPMRDGIGGGPPFEPRSVADSYEAEGDETLSVGGRGVLANDRDAYEARVYSAPSNGRLALNNDGSFTYTPDPGYVGTDSFIYRASNSYGMGNAVRVNITVRAMPPRISGVEDGASYRTSVTPSFTSGSATLNGNPFSAGTSVENEGRYTLQVTNSEGSRTVNFTIDKTAPIVEIKGSLVDGVYASGVQIVFNEGTAVLNGPFVFNTPIASSAVIEIDGGFTLTVTDAAGNVTVKSFLISLPKTVSFDSAGGSGIAPQSVVYKGKAVKPADPEREGYIFGGWYEDSGRSVPFAFNTREIVTTTMIYASWTIIRHAFTFDSAGGGDIAPQTVDYGASASEPAPPTRKGYTFVDWYADDMHTKPFVFAATPIKADTRVYASWKIDTYTAAFDSRGGSEVKQQTLDYGGAIAKPADPSRKGYTFAGWYENEADSRAFDFASAKIEEDLTLIAKWTINVYEVSFDSDGGSEVAKQSPEFGGTATKPTDPERKGYTFAGWYTDEARTRAFAFASTPIESDLTLYANWTINAYRVSFDSSGGSEIDTQTLDYGGFIAKPADPERKGYAFAGWYKNEADSRAFDFVSTKIEEELTLIAKWTINVYEVSFDSDGGSAVDAQKLDYGSVVAKPAAPVRKGYTFGGWYESGAQATEFDFASSKIERNLALRAKWTINVYDVVFDSDGGTPVDKRMLDYGSVIAKPADPERTGHTFGGWYTDEEKTQAFDFGSAVAETDLTLHAKWTINVYEVSFDSEGGSEVAKQSPEYGGAVTKPADPKREGYTFGGWYEDEAQTAGFDFASSKIERNLTLRAKWTIDTYTVAFDSAGGSVVADKRADYGTLVSEPASPTRAGYTFAGWYADAALTGRYNFSSSPVKSDLKLYARWLIVSSGSGGGTSGDGSSAPPTQPSSTSEAPAAPSGVSTDGKLTLPAGQAGEVSLGDSVRVVIPAGASSRPLTIDIEALTDVSGLLDGQSVLLSPVLEILKNFKENFDAPVELTLAYDAGSLPPGETPGVFYFDETARGWVNVPGGTAESGRVTVSVDHFTKFAVFGMKPAMQTVFSDLPAGHWARAAVDAATAKGIVRGYPDGTFRPAAPVSRAQFAAMLAAAFALPAAAAEPDFADAAKIGVWARPAVASAVAAGLAHGYPDGTFRPEATVTRAEMAAMLAAALKATAGGDRTVFADEAEIPAWAKPAVHALSEAGLLAGKPGGVFDARGRASRAEAVQLLVNALGGR